MNLPSFFRYDDDRVGMWCSNGEAVDICSLRHSEQQSGPAHVLDCLVEAVLEHDHLNQLATQRGPEPVHPERLLAPVRHPVNVFGAPVNYQAHEGELGADRSPAKGTVRELGLFVKATGSISGPCDDIELPDLPGREFHYEGEIAVIIGRRADNVPPASALDYVAGLTGALDVTLRLESDRREERSMRKSYRTFTPLGPAVLPLSDPAMASTLSLRLSVNGEARQEGDLSQLIMPVAELVSLASSIVPLSPGDVILTGTPAGVGPIEPGDVLHMQVSGLASMRLHVSRRAGVDAT